VPSSEHLSATALATLTGAYLGGGAAAQPRRDIPGWRRCRALLLVYDGGRV
jgi:hypothetical protein